MSDVRPIANDLDREPPVRRLASWRRLSRKAKVDSGRFYGLALSRVSTLAERWKLRAARRHKQLADISDQELQLVVREAVRIIRRAGFHESAYMSLAVALGEAISRSGFDQGRDPRVCAAAVNIMLGRNVTLAGRRNRQMALVIAACGAAMLGERVHVLSPDDSLAKSFFEQARIIYRDLGLSAGLASADETKSARRKAYKHAIVHTGATTLAADALGDAETTASDGRQLKSAVNFLSMPGREAARIVSGALTLFVDQADRTLGNIAARIVSVSGDTSFFERNQFASEAIELARSLLEDVDFTIDGEKALLSDAGRAKAAHTAYQYSPLWNGETRREEMLTAALEAIYLLHPGTRYAVENGAVRPVDESARKALEKNVFGVSIRSLVEVKEGIADRQAQRTRRAAPVRAVLSSYETIGAASCPGAQQLGEFWEIFNLLTIDFASNLEARIVKSVELVRDKTDKHRTLANWAGKSFDKGYDRVLILASKNEREDIVSACAEVLEASLLDRLDVFGFSDMQTLERISMDGVAVIIAGAGSSDEDWRYCLEWLFLKAAAKDIRCIIDEKDTVFGSLSDVFKSDKSLKIARFAPTLYFKRALAARRYRFSQYRIAQSAHYRAMDRVLAFASEG